MYSAQQQKANAQSQPEADRGGERATASPQGEQSPQLESMTKLNPQVQRQRAIAEKMSASASQAVQFALATMIENSPRQVAQQNLITGLGVSQHNPTQECPAQFKQKNPAKPNRTGLPDHLKTGIEQLSGMPMDHVKVHYNSAEPAQLDAFAFAQGSDIHVAPGKEKHLPHEAWHVAQQQQGRVRPTAMVNGASVNDNADLESEADVMGERAVQLSGTSAATAISLEVDKNSRAGSDTTQRLALGSNVIQRDKWATADIREQISDARNVEDEDLSGHHIISKEDLTCLWKWANDDYAAGTPRPVNAQKFRTKFKSEKDLWNLGYNITIGHTDYSNNPKNTYDPATVAVDLVAADEEFMGMELEEMEEFEVERRANNDVTARLRPLQEMINARAARNWNDERWGEVLEFFRSMGTDFDVATVNPYDADEWEEDISKRNVKLELDRMKVADGRVQVDGTYILVVDGGLVLDGKTVELDDVEVSDDGGNLMVDDVPVTLNEKNAMTVGGELLKVWTASNYRKRAGILMKNVAGEGESIFLRMALANRQVAKPAAKIHAEWLSRTEQGREMAMDLRYPIDHIMLRHSFQWWGGDITNKNVFFSPAMNDEAIVAWSHQQARLLLANQLWPLFRRRLTQIKLAEDAGDDLDDGEIRYEFTGNLNGGYINVFADAVEDEAGPSAETEQAMAADGYEPSWTMKVVIRTMAPTEASGVQVTQAALMAFKAGHPKLPLELAGPEEPKD
jgi:hypothetical protein